MPVTETGILARMKVQREKALKSLGGYKFWMFGYYAAQWANLNKLLDPPRCPNPFKYLVNAAAFMLSPTAGLREPNVWGEDPRFTRDDWGSEAANNYTSLGYWEWVFHQRQCHEVDEEDSGG